MIIGNFAWFGNAQTITDPNGQTATLSFDQLNRETSRSYSGAMGTMGDDPDSLSISYDANSNPKDITLTYSQSGSFNSHFSYDNYNRLIAVNDGYGRDIQYDYFINGNRKHVQVGNYAIDYLYENPIRLKSATATIPSVGTRSTQYSYDKSSLISQINQANNTTTTLSYDAAKRLSSIIHSTGNGAISSFNYGYDNHGNRTSQTEINGFGIENTSYSYNDLDQLLSVKYPNQETYHYTYDANYNRSTEIVQDGGGIKLMDKTYSYNNRNQLSGLVDTVNSANNVSYTYDANGNQLSKTKGSDTTLFDYDSRNQLRRIRQNGVEQGLYLYDHQGMRISKTENGQQTKYLYDGKSVLQQYHNSADVKSHYFYGNNQLLQLHHVDEGLQYYHLDSLGSVVNLTLDNGSVQARYSYDAFGHTRQQAGSSANSFGFTGHEMDHNTGLIYMKARFYDPDVGRFLNQDSYEGTLDTPPSLHKYLYAYSNPLYYVDPDGNKVDQPATDKTQVWYDDREEIPEGVQAILMGGRYHLYDPNHISFGAAEDYLKYHPDAEIVMGGYERPWYSKVARWFRDKPEGVTTEKESEVGASIGVSDDVTQQILKERQRVANLYKNAGDYIAEYGTNVACFAYAGCDVAAVVQDPNLSSMEKLGYAAATFFIGKNLGKIPNKSGFISGDAGELKSKLLAARRGDKDALGEINAAKALRAEGFNVHFRKSAGDQGIQNVRTADFFVGGERGTGKGGLIYDVFSPSSDNAGRVVGQTAKKLSQTDRVILNLDNTKLTVDDLSNIIPRVNNVPGLSRPLQEVIFVQNQKVVGRVWNQSQ